jgi:hypothetical protein
MPFWQPGYKTRRSYNILTYAVNQNKALLEVGGEPVRLLRRMRAANEHFQLEDRKVDYIEKTFTSVTLDPDTGMYRLPLWTASVNDPNEYPDIRTLTCTVQSSGGANVWESAVDKYSFIPGRNEYAFDIFNGEVDSLGNDIEDAVYVVFNTPPYSMDNTTRFIFGKINPAVSFEYMQPKIDSRQEYWYSLFSFEQWLNPTARIRRKIAPHQFLIAFPGTLTDITMTQGGFLRQSKMDHWTLTPGPSRLVPLLVEHDVCERIATGQRYQVTDYTPIYIENQQVSQHFTLVECDPNSSIYQIPIATT